jgi:hypothetical protein
MALWESGRGRQKELKMRGRKDQPAARQSEEDFRSFLVLYSVRGSLSG